MTNNINGKDLEHKLSFVVSSIQSAVSVDSICSSLNISRTEYNSLRNIAKEKEFLTQEELDAYAKKRYGRRLKRTPELIEKLVHSVFAEGMTRDEACNVYKISRSIFASALNDAVELGYITKEERQHYSCTALERANIAFNSKPEEERKKINIQRGINSAIANFDKLSEYAQKGGQATQLKHASHVKKNLKNARPYGSTPFEYQGVVFGSRGELITGLLLKEYGLIKDFIYEETFQKYFDRHSVDFYINDSLIIEYHPMSKQFVRHASVQEYLDEKVEALKDNFSGKIVTIVAPSGSFSLSEFYKKSADMGITDTYCGILEKFRKVKNLISIEEELKLQRQKECEEEIPF